MLEQEDNIFVSKDAEEYEEYTRYLKQKHQIVEFTDASFTSFGIVANTRRTISEATDCFFTDNGEETEDQRCKRRN